MKITPMKLFASASIFFTSFAILNAQEFLEFSFEDTASNQKIIFDEVNDTNNIWYIGDPAIKDYGPAYSIPNCIFTSSQFAYPPNDTSAFIIERISNGAYEFGYDANIFFRYKIESDTLRDYGLIEVSFDKGNSWLNILDDERIQYNYQKYSFTGNISDWEYCHFNLFDYRNYYEISEGDTVLIKFTFISDSLDNTKRGWFIDNLEFFDRIEGIENNNKTTSTVYPNPAKDIINISFLNNYSSTYTVKLFDFEGRCLLERREENELPITINISDINLSGLIFYVLFDDKYKMISNGKLLIQ